MCKRQVAECEEMYVKGEGSEKLKFKLVSLQLVNQIFCKKLRRKDAEIEKLTLAEIKKDGEKETEQETKSQEATVSNKRHDDCPRLSFSECHEDNCLKSKISIRFRKWSEEFEQISTINNSEGKENTGTEVQGEDKKFIARERRKGRSKSLMNYRRRFSTKKNPNTERRHHSVKTRGHREERRLQTSCPDLVEAGREEARLGRRRGPRRNTSNIYDSIDDFTNQLFTDDLSPTSEVDLLSICFE